MSAVKELKERSKLFQEVVDACQYILEQDQIAEDARNYLDSRLPRTVQKQFGFGYFPDDTRLNELISLIDKATLESVGVVYPKFVSGGAVPRGHFNSHNLVMPFRDVYGNIVSLLGRTLLSAEEQKEQKIQKYKYTLGANKDLYVFGLDLAKDDIVKNDYVICMEGQFDFISLFTAGVRNSVAVGWANMTRHQFFKLHRFYKLINIVFGREDFTGCKGDHFIPVIKCAGLKYFCS